MKNYKVVAKRTFVISRKKRATRAKQSLADKFPQVVTSNRQDDLEKPPVSGCDSSATINSDENLAERLVFKNHSRLVPLGRVASSLVLDTNTGDHRYLL